MPTPPGSIPGWRRELNDNSLDGTLPPEYSTMTKMTYLCVAYTRSHARRNPGSPMTLIHRSA